MIMKNTIVTGSLIVFSDGFVWKRLSNEKAYKIWVSAENEDFELYKVRVDDESESLIESLEDLQDAFKQGHYVCIEVGKLPYSIDLNYLRNLQELSAEAVEYLTGLKECSREEAFNIIQKWAKEFTGKEPEYVECQIVRKETGDEQRKTMKLSLNINDDDNDDVFCYCNGIESFKQLAEYGMGEFIVTFCWSFF